MSVKTFGRAFRNRRPSVHDICHPTTSSTSRPPSLPCFCLTVDTNNTPSRQFSTTSPLPASKQQIRDQKIAKTPLPAFPKTSNAPLDTLLQTLHRDQFLIDHLPDHYRRLVLRTKRHHVLAAQAAQQAFALGVNPSTATLSITLDNQTLPLRPIKHRTYHGSKSLITALNLMNSPEEYDILPPLVSAMAFSRIQVTPEQWKKLIRKCGLVGRPGVAIKIANEGIIHRKNGFVYTLSSLREMVRAQFVRFLLPDVKDAEKSVRRARTVVGLARRWKEQFDALREKKRDSDRAPEWLSVDPVVLGSILFLQTGKVVRWNGGKDEVTEGGGGELMSVRDVKALMECWDMATEEIDGISKDLNGSEQQDRPNYAIARDAVRDWEPVSQALEWTQTVLYKSGVKDAEVERWLPSASRLVSEALRKWKAVAVTGGKGERIGMQIYEGAYEDLGDWYTKDLEGKSENVIKDKILLNENTSTDKST
ncbi:hypothetical protein AA313_de0205777 [Arthrobotrys entomopaga]|nr:hypothetical protein AA313_de0205777 [Arthrobotrys entomopaga]